MAASEPEAQTVECRRCGRVAVAVCWHCNPQVDLVDQVLENCGFGKDAAEAIEHVRYLERRRAEEQRKIHVP